MVEKRWIERIIDKDNWGFGAASQACDNISLALCLPSLLMIKQTKVKKYYLYFLDGSDKVKAQDLNP